MTVRFWLDEIQFSDTTRIKLSKNDIVVLVGPNNAGKSATLKEVMGLIKASHFKGKVVKALKIEREGSESDFFSLIASNSIINNAKEQPLYSGFGFSFYKSVAKSNWDNYKDGIEHIFSIFCNLLTTEQRLQAANPATSIQLTKKPVEHPIHFLQRNDKLEQKFSDYFRQAFGMDLIIHRNSGSIVPFYVGNKPIPKAGDDRVSESYLKELEDLGGSWSTIETDWKLVKKEIEQKRPEFLTTDVNKEINTILSSTSDRIFPKSKISDIQKCLKKASAWTEAKEVGKAFIPSGNATQAFERLQIEFIRIGLLIPEVGELESFVKSVGNHGPKWVSDVLSKDLKNDKELELARQFVNQMTI